ncbi:hypothetical protein XarjCFBP7653_17280 [Xanthomonas arboricola]|nr:hypothetical protein XarjCFBP7653_17280 [Xanthomonas arboricola]
MQRLIGVLLLAGKFFYVGGFSASGQSPQLDPALRHPHTSNRSLETPHTAVPTSDFLVGFLCSAIWLGTARRSYAGRAANTTPARGISPPAVCGF